MYGLASIQKDGTRGMDDTRHRCRHGRSQCREKYDRCTCYYRLYNFRMITYRADYVVPVYRIVSHSSVPLKIKSRALIGRQEW